MSRHRKKVLFVGSFKEATKDGSVGGQMFASKTLINSELKNEFEFLLIDSTSDTVPAPAAYKRLLKVFARFLKLIRRLVFSRPQYVLIFSSAGLSLIEKGLMAIVSKLCFAKVIFAPRSGIIKDQVEVSRFYKFYIKIIVRVSNIVICQGQTWKLFYSSLGKYKSEKFIIVPNWIDTSVYHKNRPRYINENVLAVQLIYIGWIEEYKGIFDLINAINIVKNEVCKLQISIYGSGSKLDEAKKLCIQLDIEEKIIFGGWANFSMKMKALSTADIYILPSHAEGFPNALLEALASGIPSIATDVGGVSDLIINNETGLLVQPKNPGELAGAILTLYKNPALRSKFSKNGRERVQNFHSLQAMYTKMRFILQH